MTEQKGLYIQYSLRKLAFAIYRDFCQRRNLKIFTIFPQNYDCGYKLEQHRRGGSNAYHNVLTKNTKDRYTPAYPSFTI